MNIRYFGVRGSIATPGPKTVNYGGNTTCIELESSKGDHYIIDAGTGIRELGLDLLRRHAGQPFAAKLFITHTHWDHIQGFPFFIPAYLPKNEFTIYSGEKRAGQEVTAAIQTELSRLAQDAALAGKITEHAFTKQMSDLVFPVSLEDMLSKPRFVDLKEGEMIENGLSVSYKAFPFGHPDGMFSYKFTEGDKRFIVQADFEHEAVLPKPLRTDSVLQGKETEKMHYALIEWWKGADAVYFDAMYLPEQYDPVRFGKKTFPKRTWGHSTYEKGIDFAVEAGVKHIILGHHEPMHDDASLDLLYSRAKEYASSKSKDLKVSMAIEGSTLSI